MGRSSLRSQLRDRAVGVRRWLAGGLRGRPTALVVDRDTFHKLHVQVAELAAAIGPEGPIPGLVPFEPHPLTEADGVLLQWLEGLRRSVAGLPIEIGEPDPELLDLLGTVARKADPQNEAELLRLLGALTGGVFRGPHTFHLDVANACNVNCKYCWFHSPLAKNRKDVDQFDAAWRREMIDWDLFCALVDDLAALGTREDLLLSGKGEPLLHPRCLDMVAYIKNRGLGLTLFSNGLLVGQEAREALVDHGANLLYVSLSSASHEVYEFLHPGHPGAELDEVRERIGALNELKRQRAVELPRVMMVDVLCRTNAHEVLDFYELARELGAEHVRYQLIHVQDYNEELKLLPEQIPAVREAMAEAHRREEQGGPSIVTNIDYQLETLDPATGKWGHARTPDEGCYVGWTFSRSWTNGDVSFCCSPKVVGTLVEQPFREIWTGSAYGDFRRAARDLQRNAGMTFRNGAPLLGEHCNGCPNYEGIGKLAADLGRYDLDRFVRGSDGARLQRRDPVPGVGV